MAHILSLKGLLDYDYIQAMRGQLNLHDLHINTDHVFRLEDATDNFKYAKINFPMTCLHTLEGQSTIWAPYSVSVIRDAINNKTSLPQ